MPIQIILNPMRQSDAAINDLAAELSRVIRGEWKLLALSARYWLLIRFPRHDDVTDHPLRSAGGNQDGKGRTLWFERDHEILGIGATPSEAARSVLTGIGVLRLQARQVFDVEHRKHLLFRDLNSGRDLWPDQLVPTLRH